VYDVPAAGKEYSYAYQAILSNGRNGINMLSEAGLAIMADRPHPEMGDSPDDEDYERISTNHNEESFNILYKDNHAESYDTNRAGMTRNDVTDNVYTASDTAETAEVGTTPAHPYAEHRKKTDSYLLID
jgi:hypothetical protein